MQLRSLFISLVLSIGVVTQATEIRPVTPEPKLTPGELCDARDPDFTEYRYKERVPYCERNVDSQLRAEIYATYRVEKNDWSNYTIDHFIPLSIGGNNADSNLWPEHKKIKALRQNLEMETFLRLQKGEINQSTAIDIIINAKMNPPLQTVLLEGVLFEEGLLQ